MTPDKLPVYSTWQLKEHDKVERPYWEITNGPISMCVDDEDIEEEHITAMKEIVSALNSGGIKFHSENALELEQHIEIMQLRDQAQRMEDALEELTELKQMKDELGKTTNYLTRQPTAWKRATEALQQFKDGKGREVDGKCRCVQPNWNAFTGKCLTCGKQ